MLILDDGWARASPSFSFEAAILEGFNNELDNMTLDIRPIDAESQEDPAPLYNMPGGAPLTLPLPSTSADAAPQCLQPQPLHGPVSEQDTFGGDSPLSSAPSSCAPSPGPTKSSKKRSQNKKSKARRAKKRQMARAEDVEASQQPAARSREKHVTGSQPTKVGYDAKNIPSASMGYVATQDTSGGGMFTLANLLEQGFTLVKWDGRSSKPIVDSNGLVVAALVGHPNDPTWQGTHKEAFELLQSSASLCNFTEKCMNHRCGNFAALNAGISFGGGPQKPGNLHHNKVRAEVLQGLLKSNCFVRLAGFASKSFSTWMPRLHKLYDACMKALIKNDGNLRPNFKNSVWGAVTFNFGPRTTTVRHRDAANIPYGICSVTALGRYNYVKGRHVVLWEFGLVVEFLPGSTILIPLAAVTHSNTPVTDTEERCSFTQYSAGGLFRWVDQGFQKKDKYLASLSEEELEKLPELDKARCALGMLLFSTLAKLCSPAPSSPSPSDSTRPTSTKLSP